MKILVYALKSIGRNYLYIGMTNDLVRRKMQHDSGRERTTRAYAPFQLLYAEEHNNRSDARKQEKYLKSGTGREWLKNL